MAVTAQATGSVSAASGVENTLTDVAVAGTFTLHVDCINAASGDVVELRIYQIVLTGGTRRVAYYARYDGVQPTDDMIKVSVPVSNELTDAGSLRFTLTLAKGLSTKVFNWKVLRYA